MEGNKLMTKKVLTRFKVSGNRRRICKTILNKFRGSPDAVRETGGVDLEPLGVGSLEALAIAVAASHKVAYGAHMIIGPPVHFNCDLATCGDLRDKASGIVTASVASEIGAVDVEDRTVIWDLPLDAGDLGRRVRIDIRIPSRIGLSSNNSTLWESVTEDSGGKERAEREDGEGKHDERLKE